MERLVPRVATLLIAALLSGCAGPLEPPGTDSRSLSSALGARQDGRARLFYPLDLGNRWLHRQTFVLASDPDTETFPPVRIGSQYVRQLTCLENRGGVDYVIEHIEVTDTTVFGPQVANQWVRYRQDASGLYEADVSLAEPAACAGAPSAEGVSRARRDAIAAAIKQSWAQDEASAERAARTVIDRVAMVATIARSSSGALPGELTRLRYPLTPGTSWVIRTDPLYTATVEALEPLDLPVGRVLAHRVRIEAPFFGPHDRIHFWFAREGMLRMLVHIEIPTDIGMLIADEHQWVEEISIRRGRF